MDIKILAFLLVLAAVATANPRARRLQHLIPKMPMVTPNPKGLSFPTFYEETKKPTPIKPRIPGTKAVPGCGLLSAPSQRIVGGSEAVPHSYPWQVALTIDFMFFCGGWLINEEWVVTAGHCTTGASRIDVLLGAHDQTVNEPSQVTIVATGADIITHENYGPVMLANDIGLVHLPTPVVYTADIAPVCLPAYSDAQLPAGTMVTMSGWGKTSDASSSVSATLNEVTKPVITNAECAAVYGAIITNSIFCTDTTGGQGTCNGDSGGPVNYVSGGITYSRGITSFVASAGCESGFPDGFTRVDSFLDWIEARTGIAIDP